MRKVICHYHIYKNSGTSFDKVLTSNYGEKHISFDGPFPFFTIDQEQLARIIDRKVDVIAFSSHQIQLPVPVSLDFEVLPAVFIRHPLLRILSIYKFKRQTFDGTSTSRYAQEMNFNDWIQFCFSNKQEITHISNAQTRLISSAFRQRPLMKRVKDGMIYDVDQAIRNINNVKLLARTEFFDEDVGRFKDILSSYEIDFNYEPIKPQNTTSNTLNKSIEERINSVKEQLTKDNYERLLLSNSQDMMIFNVASSLINNS